MTGVTSHSLTDDSTQDILETRTTLASATRTQLEETLVLGLKDPSTSIQQHCFRWCHRHALDSRPVCPHLRESSLMTTYWTESTLSS